MGTEEILSPFGLRRIVPVRIKNAREERTSAKAVFFGTPKTLHVHLEPHARGHLQAGETCDLEYWTDRHAYSVKATVATTATEMGMAQLRLDECSIAREIERTRRREQRWECRHEGEFTISPRDKRPAGETPGLDFAAARFAVQVTDLSENGASLALARAGLPPLFYSDSAAINRFWLDTLKGLTISLSFSYIFLKTWPDQFEQEVVRIEAVVRNVRIRENDHPLRGPDEPPDYQLGIEFEYAASDPAAEEKILFQVKSKQVLLIVMPGDERKK